MQGEQAPPVARHEAVTCDELLPRILCRSGMLRQHEGIMRWRQPCTASSLYTVQFLLPVSSVCICDVRHVSRVYIARVFTNTFWKTVHSHSRLFPTHFLILAPPPLSFSLSRYRIRDAVIQIARAANILDDCSPYYASPLRSASPNITYTASEDAAQVPVARYFIHYLPSRKWWHQALLLRCT